MVERSNCPALPLAKEEGEAILKPLMGRLTLPSGKLLVIVIVIVIVVIIKIVAATSAAMLALVKTSKHKVQLIPIVTDSAEL